jgi:hypothetical protein
MLIPVPLPPPPSIVNAGEFFAQDYAENNLWMRDTKDRKRGTESCGVYKYQDKNENDDIVEANENENIDEDSEEDEEVEDEDVEDEIVEDDEDEDGNESVEASPRIVEARSFTPNIIMEEYSQAYFRSVVDKQTRSRKQVIGAKPVQQIDAHTGAVVQIFDSYGAAARALGNPSDTIPNSFTGHS